MEEQVKESIEPGDFVWIREDSALFESEGLAPGFTKNRAHKVGIVKSKNPPTSQSGGSVINVIWICDVKHSWSSAKQLGAEALKDVSSKMFSSRQYHESHLSVIERSEHLRHLVPKEPELPVLPIKDALTALRNEL